MSNDAEQNPNKTLPTVATMSTIPTMVEKLRGLRWSVVLNATNTVFTQFTYFGSAFVIFLDQLGLSKSDIGFVLALIPFSNLLAILIAPPPPAMAINGPLCCSLACAKWSRHSSCSRLGWWQPMVRVWPLPSLPL
ncbi:MAG: hypothetical protein R2867_08765 [Caldilineaceae bacterium]